MVKRFLNENNKLYLLLFFISLVSYHFAYGLFTLNPTNIGWLMNAYHDWGQHYLGAAYYRQEAWHFPLGDMNTFYYPVGTNVGFTDCIPLMAFLTKIFSVFLPEDFQYFGFWLFSCMYLNAFFTAKILKLFRVNNIIIILACILMITNPVLIFRGIQASACAHWLFLGSFYYYLKPTNKESVVSNYKKQGLMMLLSAAINPYLAIMTTGFVVILSIKNYFYDKSLTKKMAFLLPVAAIAVSVVFWIVFGMLELKSKTDLAVGTIYGKIYSFNLNSFYNSYGFYSKFIPQLGMTNDTQHEGFAYLGLGMIILVVFSLIVLTYFIITKKINKKHSYVLPLVLLCFFMLIFAITNVVTYGTEIIFEYPTLGIVEKVGDVFRAVGRFSWPFYYLLYCMAFVVFSKAKMNTILKCLLLLSITCFQLYDIENIITSRDLKSGGFDSKLDEEKWKLVIDNFDEVLTYPPYINNMVYKMDYQDLMFVALKSKKPISIGYVARENVVEGRAYKDTLYNRIKRGEIAKNQLFVTNKENLKDFDVLIYKGKVNIKRLDKFLLIYSKATPLRTEYKELPEDKKYVDSVQNYYSSLSVLKPFKSPIVTKEEIQFNIESFVNSEDVIQITGWAFLKATNNNSKDTIYIALSSKSNTYIFPTKTSVRGDITGAFKKENLDNSGFSATFFTDKLPKDTYNLALVIKDKNGNYHSSKTDLLSEVGKKDFKKPLEIKSTPTAGDIISNIEKIETKKGIINISGWAANNKQSSKDKAVKIVLISAKHKYEFETDLIIRNDVTVYLENKFNYDFSGFKLKIRTEDIDKGDYTVGIIIKDNKTSKETFKLSDKKLKY
ncbi:MAG: DUF6311 domain-containing protein [Flavobacterium sp.]|nr:DUF6311 domain-containing protein [Flavobacterium sp.]